MKCLLILCFFLVWITSGRGQITSGAVGSGQLFRGYYNTFSSTNIQRRFVPSINIAGSSLTRQAFMVQPRTMFIRAITPRTVASVSPSVNVASWTTRPRIFTQPIRVIPLNTGNYLVNSAPQLANLGQLSPILNSPSVHFVTPSVLQFPLTTVRIPLVNQPSLVPSLSVPPVNVVVMSAGQLQPNVQENGTARMSLSLTDTQRSMDTRPSSVQDSPNSETDNLGGDQLMVAESRQRMSNSSSNADIILGNILDNIRQSRMGGSISNSSQNSRERTIDRSRDNILRQGDRLFKPLYKGHFRGQRIVLARNIGTADRLPDSSTTGIDSFNRSDIAGRLVGESKLDFTQRITQKMRLPSADLMNRESGFFPSSEIESTSRNMLDRSTDTSQGGGVQQSSELFSDDVLSNSVDEQFGETGSSQSSQETINQLSSLSKFFPTDFGVNSQHDSSQVIRTDQSSLQSDPNTDTAFVDSGNLQAGIEPNIQSSDHHIVLQGEIAQNSLSASGSTASETRMITALDGRGHDIMHEQTAPTNTGHDQTGSQAADFFQFAESDGFFAQDSTDVQQTGSPDTFSEPLETNPDQMTTGLDVSNSVEEPRLLNAEVTNPRPESISTNDARVPLQAFNEEMVTQNTETSPDIGMMPMSGGSASTFDNSRDLMRDSQVGMFGSDTGNPIQSRGRWFQRRTPLNMLRSTNDNMQTSRFDSETTRGGSLSCPSGRMNHGNCRKDLDCQRGYCYQRVYVLGICCD